MFARLIRPCLAASLLVLLLASAAQAREIGLHADPVLSDLGVRASVGAVPDQADAKAEAVVFVTYEKAFHGKLYLSCFRDDNTEIGRSRQVAVDEAAESGGHVIFVFDKPTDLTQAASLVLYGAATPRPKEESIGDKAKSIVKELLE